MFIVFRFFSGAGGNLLSATVPIWMAEVVPAKNRGLLVDLHGAMYVLGYMAAAWVGYGFYFMDSKEAWRPPFGENYLLQTFTKLTHSSFTMPCSTRPPCRDILAAGKPQVAAHERPT